MIICATCRRYRSPLRLPNSWHVDPFVRSIVPHVDQHLSDEGISAGWQKVAQHADLLAGLSATPGEFTAKAGSEAVLDDATLGGYNLSTAVIHGLLASIDHLHALTTLVVKTKVLHLNATYSLARGVLENAAASFWIVHPVERSERRLRALRYWGQNANDGDAVRTAFPDAGGTPSTVVIKKLQAAARANELPIGKIAKGYTSTEAVKYSNRHAKMADGTSIGVLFPWQLCSAFAHGRMWASLGALHKEVAYPSPDPQHSNLQLTNNLGMALWPVLQGFQLIRSLLRIWQIHSRPGGLTAAWL